MTNRNAFVTGAGLLGGYIIIEFSCCIISFAPSVPSSLFIISDHLGEIIPAARYLALAGCLLLLNHHYHANEEGRKPYRNLDRFLALAVMALGGMVIVGDLLTPADFPSDYVGYLLYLECGQKALWVLLPVFWGFFLWCGQIQKAMVFSVLCITMLLLPRFPANNPFLEEQTANYLAQTPLVETSDPAIQEGQDWENFTDSTEKETSPEYDGTPIYTSYVIFLGLPMYVLLCIYTWMRGTNKCYPKSEESQYANSLSIHKRQRAFRKGEAVLLLFIPVYFASWILLPWLPLNGLFLDGHVITWCHLGLTGILLLALAGLLWGIGSISTERAYTTDFYLRILLLLLMLPFILGILDSIKDMAYFLFYSPQSQSYLFPGYSFLHLVEKFVVACVGFYGLRSWRRGLQGRQPLPVLIGAALVIYLATQSNDTLSRMRSSIIPEEVRVSESAAHSSPPQEQSPDPEAHVPENEYSPSPTERYLLSPQLTLCTSRVIRLYFIILLCFTMVRWGGCVASKKEDGESEATACEILLESCRISHKESTA